MTLLSISAISKSFSAYRALDDVSLDVGQGEFISLLGPSGCGKTTLLRIIAGFTSADTGQITIEGQDITRLPPNHRPLNTVFQNYALFPHMSVLQNVAYGPMRSGANRHDATVRAREALEMVGLAHLADRSPRQMSGGQQQRVALARAIVNRPKLLLLDEPLSALDLQLRKRMQIELKQLQAHLGITFIFVTHDQEEAMVMSDRIAVMSAGRIEQIDGGKQIYHQPRSRFVAEFIGEANFLPLAPSGLSLAPRGDAPRTGVLRPENLALFAAGVTLPEGLLSLTARVETITYVGGTSNIYLQDGALRLHARLYGPLPDGIAEGVVAQCAFRHADLHILEG
ncbi:ABC transporter ATP-binding protein [Gemmobacter fulvus]|uniref:ABC transporter ATP-binding protein n=1 Tax=Gemmobacter fulvus TaxID=2840474 RepID=UPI002796E24F|nr:ABC transporter ATP-binding protein [Gemmobacter fulvus]MDQ1848283.1 ABC transporter ATP-binding protein [Gemmobacter fulvus]